MAEQYAPCSTETYSLDDAVVILPDEFHECQTHYRGYDNTDEAGFFQYINDNNFVLAYRIISGSNYHARTLQVIYHACDTARPTCEEFYNSFDWESAIVPHKHYISADYCDRTVNRHDGIISHIQLDSYTDCTIVETESYLYSEKNCHLEDGNINKESKWFADGNITVDIEKYVPMPIGFSCPINSTLINGVCTPDEGWEWCSDIGGELCRICSFCELEVSYKISDNGV